VILVTQVQIDSNGARTVGPDEKIRLTNLFVNSGITGRYVGSNRLWGCSKIVCESCNETGKVESAIKCEHTKSTTHYFCSHGTDYTTSQHD